MSNKPNFETNYEKIGKLKAFVNEGRSLIWARKVLTTPLWILSWVKRQSTSICFDHSWKTGFTAKWMAAWLSLNNIAGLSWEISMSFKKLFSHIMSHVCGSQRYYASTKELDKLPYFFDFQKTKAFPK